MAVFNKEITKIEQYWCWRRVISLVLLITFPSTLFIPTLAYSNQNLHDKTQAATEFSIYHKSKTKPRTDKNKKVITIGKEIPAINNLRVTSISNNYAIKDKPFQNDTNSLEIFPKHNKYQPYFELGGAKYFNQKSKVAGIYDLFIPLLQTDDHLFFTDLRFFDRSGSSSEGNLHLGYRRLFPNSNKMLGIYGAFDLKKSEHGNRYNQVMFGVEYWQNKWFIGANIYKPLGTTRNLFKEEKLPIETPTSRGISDTKYYEKALAGGDAEIGYAFTDSFTLYGGGYYFHADGTGTIAGPKTRVTYNYNKPIGKILGVLDGISVEAGAQYDKKRRATAYIEIKLKIGLTNLEKNSNLLGFERHMTELVRRDPDIVLGNVQKKFYQPGEYGFQEGNGPDEGKGSSKEHGDYDSKWLRLKELLKKLDLPEGAQKEEVNRRFRELALKHHPDKGGKEEVFRQLNKDRDGIINILDDYPEFNSRRTSEQNTTLFSNNFTASQTASQRTEVKASQNDDNKERLAITDGIVLTPSQSEDLQDYKILDKNGEESRPNHESNKYSTIELERKDKKFLEPSNSYFSNVEKTEPIQALPKPEPAIEINNQKLFFDLTTDKSLIINQIQVLDQKDIVVENNEPSTKANSDTLDSKEVMVVQPILLRHFVTTDSEEKYQDTDFSVLSKDNIVIREAGTFSGNRKLQSSNIETKYIKKHLEKYLLYMQDSCLECEDSPPNDAEGNYSDLRDIIIKEDHRHQYYLLIGKNSTQLEVSDSSPWFLNATGVGQGAPPCYFLYEQLLDTEKEQSPKWCPGPKCRMKSSGVTPKSQDSPKPDVIAVTVYADGRDGSQLSAKSDNQASNTLAIKPSTNAEESLISKNQDENQVAHKINRQEKGATSLIKDVILAPFKFLASAVDYVFNMLIPIRGVQALPNMEQHQERVLDLNMCLVEEGLKDGGLCGLVHFEEDGPANVKGWHNGSLALIDIVGLQSKLNIDDSVLKSLLPSKRGIGQRGPPVVQETKQTNVEPSFNNTVATVLTAIVVVPARFIAYIGGEIFNALLAAVKFCLPNNPDKVIKEYTDKVADVDIQKLKGAITKVENNAQRLNEESLNLMEEMVNSENLQEFDIAV